MSYLPPYEKLTALGFTEFTFFNGGSKQCSIRTSSTTARVFLDYGKADRFSLVNFDGEDARASQTLFRGACPDEAFFDQLLIAVGWQSLHEPK